MKITDKLTITKRAKDGAFYGERNGTPYVIDAKTDMDIYKEFSVFYNTMRQTQYEDRPSVLSDMVARDLYPHVLGADLGIEKKEVNPKLNAESVLKRGINGLMSFFTEFSFTPSFRFTNTLAFMLQDSRERAINYIKSYFALMDSSYKKEIGQKVKSAEFNSVLDDIFQYGAPTSHINTRLKIYYGSAGTGKTTLAQKESDNRCIVCNSSMLPSDLMEDFIFRDGNPDFNPSLLWDCMEQGKTIVLDEINLLPFDSLRFLQGIVDGKTEFYYKNRPVHIKEGFQIIGTMNLNLGGMTYGLPEPLVDRCCDTVEFTLTAEQLAKSILGGFDDKE